ncbi:MAG: tRNA lysidine(34) synthetase TilS [Acidobacteria bacterium]|nr:tRNA lysidine(34) synthetase TilS [Acidobacteriota bacterium]
MKLKSKAICATTVALLDKVSAFIRRHDLIHPGQRIGVAVSGGADSLCLLHVLLELRKQLPVAIHLIHVNHQLRGDASEQDQAFVESLGKEYGLAMHVHRASIPGGENLEQAARQVRLDFFRELRSTLDRIATGHTLSDQAETVLFRFLRGAGTSGLAGILPVTADGLIRPLLCVTRAEVEQYLTARNFGWRTDATNLQRDFTRNRIRLDLLPELERDYNPGLTAQLAHTADIAREEEEFWSGYLARHPLPRKQDGALILPTTTLQGQPKAVARRLLREAIRQIKGDLREIEYKHVEIALRLALQSEGAGRAHLPGIDLFRSFDFLRLAPLGSYAPERRVISLPLAVPGDTPLPEGGIVLRTSLLDSYNEDKAEETSCKLLDLDRMEGPLTVRYWLPGDSYLPAGATRVQKLKDLFQLHRIPLWERRFWPMVESSQGIVWSRRFGPAGFAAPVATSGRLLRIDELSND